MTRRLSLLTVVLVGILFWAQSSQSQPLNAPSISPVTPIKSIDKLLNTPTNIPSEAEWNLEDSRNQVYFNVRQILKRNTIQSLSEEMSQKVLSAKHARRSIEISA